MGANASISASLSDCAKQSIKGDRKKFDWSASALFQSSRFLDHLFLNDCFAWGETAQGKEKARQWEGVPPTYPPKT